MSESKDSLKEAKQNGAKQKAGKNFRRLLWFIVFVAVVYFIVRNISAFGNVLLVVLGFGAVVLVHEFGHFIVAKLSGIKIEAFSIGFPPTLVGVLRTENGYRVRILPRFFPKENDESVEGGLSFTIGRGAKASDTEYRIGLIPFGGYVKMLGQEDVGLVKGSDDPRSFANKPVGTRMGVLAAGVVFNAISAIVVFMIVFLIGIRLLAPVVGRVEPNSPAARAGVKAGDEVIEIDGSEDDLDFSNIAIAAALSNKGEEVALRVRHEDGSEEDFAIVAELLQGGPMKAFGVWPAQSLTIAKVSDVNALHEKTGLLPGDRIKAVNGKDVQSHWELTEIVENTLASEVRLSAERTDEAGRSKVVESRVRLELISTGTGHIYSMVPRLRLEEVKVKKSFWIKVAAKMRQVLEKIGILQKLKAKPFLQSGDIILAIGEKGSPTYEEFREVIQEYEKRELRIKVLRVDSKGVEENVTVTVVPKRTKDGKRVVIGISLFPAFDAEHPVVAKTVDVEGGPTKLEIPRGAVITAVGGVGVSNFSDCLREIGRHAGERITIDWRIDEETAGSVALDVGAAGEFVTVKSTFAEYIPFKRLERLYKASGPIDAMVMGYRKTVMFIAQAYVTLKRLLGGRISPKGLMGPVGIITLSYTVVAHQPLVYYVYFLGLISACIAVFNFLPLPPLDGGLVVILLIEKIKGSALSERTQGIVAYAGWVLIGGFFLYVTFNDIVRSFFS